MKLNKVLVLCVFFINYNTQFVASRTTIVFYDEIQNCDEFCTKNECYDIVDVSNLKMILDEEDYTVAYLNGSLKYNMILRSPFSYTIWAEKRYGTKWAIEAFYRRYPDACKDLKNPLDPAYRLFEGKINCPHQKGELYVWDMYKIRLPLVIPPSFIGEWRLVFMGQLNSEGDVKNQCVFFRGDVYEA